MEEEPLDNEVLEKLLRLDQALRDNDLSARTGLPGSGEDHPAVRAAESVLTRLEAEIPRRPDLQSTWRPTRIGRFEIERVLGSGGFSVVYAAIDHSVQRKVAIKIPRPLCLVDASLRQRFMNEARAAGRLDHPNIAPVYDTGVEGDLPYIVSALCDGPDLEQWMAERENPCPPRTAAAIIAQLADGVQCSHSQGIIHRDIKPGNVLLFPDAQSTCEDFPYVPRLTDFGLAKLSLAGQSDSHSTHLLGTPRYMAPEVIRGSSKNATAKSDIYALGALLYALLTGQAPFASSSTAEMLRRIVDSDPVPPVSIDPSIPLDLNNICLKCLEKREDDRYSSAADLRDDLKRYLNGEIVLARNAPMILRCRKWLQRHPVAMVAFVISGIFLIASSWIVLQYTLSLKRLQSQLKVANNELKKQVDDLDKAIILADENGRIAAESKRRSQELLLISDLSMAGRMWHQGDSRGAMRLLKDWRQQMPQMPARESTSFAMRSLLIRASAEYNELALAAQVPWWLGHDRQNQRILVAGSAGNVESLPDTGGSLSLISRLSGDELSCGTISDDGSLLCVLDDDGCLHTLSLITRAEPTVRTICDLRSIEPRGIQFLPESHQVIVCGNRSVMQIRDATSGRLVREIEAPHQLTEAVAMSPDKRYLTTSGGDGRVGVYSLPDLILERSVKVSDLAVTVADLSHDSRFLVCFAGDLKIHLFDRVSGERLSAFTSQARVHALAPNDKGELLVGDRDGVLTLFAFPDSPESGPSEIPTVWEPIRRWAGHESPVSAILWHSSLNQKGQWISADRHGRILQWAPQESPIHSIAHPETIDAAVGGHTCLNADGSQIFRTTTRGIEVIDLHTQATRSLPADENLVCVAFHEDSERLIAGTATGKLIWVAAAEDRTGPEIREPAFELPTAGETSLHELSIGGKDAVCAIIDSEKILNVVRLRNRSLIFQRSNVDTATVTQDGKYVAVGLSSNDDVLIIRVEDEQQVAVLKGHSSTIARILFSSDGSTCITTSHDRTVRIWNTENWQQTFLLTGHTLPIRAAAIRPHGKTLATCDNSTIKLWDIELGREVLEFDVGVTGLKELFFVADGRLVARDKHRVLHLFE